MRSAAIDQQDLRQLKEIDGEEPEATRYKGATIVRRVGHPYHGGKTCEGCGGLRFANPPYELQREGVDNRGGTYFHARLPGMDVKEAGRLGAMATNRKLSKKKRQQNARRAAEARWSNRR